MKKSGIALLLVLAVAVLAGCSSRSSYVRSHPYMSKEDREAMMDGRVRPGFNKDMVRASIGEPSNVTTTARQDGTEEVWLYPDVTHVPLFGNVKNEYTYVYFEGDTVVKVRTTKGSEKYQEHMEKAVGGE